MKIEVELDDLNLWRQFFETLRVTMLKAEMCGHAGEMQLVLPLLRQTHDVSLRMGQRLELAGAERPPHLPAPPEVPLELLSSPANRRLADALRDAYEAAAEVDHERGYGEDGPASLLAMMWEAVRLEIYGPSGRGLE